MTPIDEAALKADPSDSEIMEIAGRWFHTGENQHRADGYYYRSLGTPTNVRGSDLIAFARALLHRSQPVARSRGFNATAILEARDAAWRECRQEVGTQGWTTAEAAAYFGFFCHGWDHRAGLDTVVPAEQAEDSAMLDWLEREHFSLSAIKEPCGDDQFALWWQVTQGRKSISGHPLASPREAIRAAIGRNREAGGS